MTALKLWSLKKSRRANASACCSPAVNPGLLGQLILATVATQAARNSLITSGAPAGLTAVFADEQLFEKKAMITIAAIIAFEFICIFDLCYFNVFVLFSFGMS